MATTAFGIEEAARRAGHYKWLEMTLFEVLGAWVATVPELDVKRTLGVHCHHHAWHAELWHELLPEHGADLAELTAPPNGTMADFMTALRQPHEPEATIEKLVGVYRVLLPHKIAAYGQHLENTSDINDGPTIRSLRLVINDEVDDWREGEMLLQALIDTREAVDRAVTHQTHLEKLLVEAGGIAGPGTMGRDVARDGDTEPHTAR
jgi:hypothetical protein